MAKSENITVDENTIDIIEFAETDITEELTEAQLGLLSKTCMEAYQQDLISRGDLEETFKKIKDLVENKLAPKTIPWENAHNINIPYILRAAIEFNARAYTALITDDTIVDTKSNNKQAQPNPQPAQVPEGQAPQAPQVPEQSVDAKISAHMSYQLMDEQPNWDTDTDTLLLEAPIWGCYFRKKWHDPVLGRQASKILSPYDFIVSNDITHLDEAEFMTEKFKLTKNELISRIRAGEYLDEDDRYESYEDGKLIDLLEQHCVYDMDEDGYAEPYIVTLDEESGHILRVVGNFTEENVLKNDDGEIYKIIPEKYYIKYPFIPRPGKGFYDLGFGEMLLHLNTTINDTLNSMMDAADLQNAGGGLIGANVRIKSGEYRTQIGEWTKVQVSGGTLKDGIVPYPAQGPSPVMFQLLEFLIQTTEATASMQAVLTGEGNEMAQPTTAIAMIEQGLKVYNGILKRMHRAMREEFAVGYRLNELYFGGDNFQFAKETFQVTQADYVDNSMKVIPVADLSEVTDAQRMAKTAYLQTLIGDPLTDQAELRKRIWTNMNIQDIPNLFAKPQTEPTPQELLQEAITRAATTEAESKMITSQANLMKAQIDLMKAEPEMAEKYAQAVERIVNAQVNSSDSEFNQATTIIKESQNERTRLDSVETQPSNQGIL